MLRYLVVLGGDAIGCHALSEIVDFKNLEICIDRSGSFSRVLKLIKKKRISIPLFVKMLYCEMRRRAVQPLVVGQKYREIRSNSDLITIIEETKPKKIILFRAGLVINQKVIDQGTPLMNIHCAKVPEYGGLGSIERALKDNSLLQEATLHQVTKRIDEGEVFGVESFELQAHASYCKNEEIAYAAGIRLLKKVLANG